MSARELYAALVALCQSYGFTTQQTYALLHQVVSSIQTDDGD